MQETLTVQLAKLQLPGSHGVFAGEEAWGTLFELNISLTLAMPAQKPLQLSDTVDYAKAYDIVRECFAVRTELLENLACGLAAALAQAFPQVEQISVSIAKLNPPIAHLKGQVGIEYVWRR